MVAEPWRRTKPHLKGVRVRLRSIEESGQMEERVRWMFGRNYCSSCGVRQPLESVGNNCAFSDVPWRGNGIYTGRNTGLI